MARRSLPNSLEGLLAESQKLYLKVVAKKNIRVPPLTELD